MCTQIIFSDLKNVHTVINMANKNAERSSRNK